MSLDREGYTRKALWRSLLQSRQALWPAAWCYLAPPRVPDRNSPPTAHVQTLSQCRRPPRKLQWSGRNRRKLPTISPTSSARAVRCRRRRLSESAGGVTQNDIVNIVRGLAVVGPPRPPGPKGDSSPFNNVLLSHAVVAFDLPPPHPCPF